MSDDKRGGEGFVYLPGHPVPDPTARTIETLEREVDWLQERADFQLKSAEIINAERHASQRREDDIRETHRLELKADNQRTVETAMVAAEKAVQAALAAAEKARDQQTIASQLATEKATLAGKEQMEQQGTTFTLAISGLTTGLNDLKSMVGELRAEKRGGQEQVTERRSSATQVIASAAIAAALFGGALTAIIVRVFGG